MKQQKVKPRSEILFSPLLKKGHRHKKHPTRTEEKKKAIQFEMGGLKK